MMRRLNVHRAVMIAAFVIGVLAIKGCPLPGGYCLGDTDCALPLQQCRDGVCQNVAGPTPALSFGTNTASASSSASASSIASTDMNVTGTSTTGECPTVTVMPGDGDDCARRFLIDLAAERCARYQMGADDLGVAV